VSVTESGGAVVEVRISAQPALIPTVRAVASDLAGRADFDLDAISDLRMAVDEACNTLIGFTSDDGVLVCRFSVAADSIEVTVSTRAASADAKIGTDSFGWRVLETLADEVQADRGLDGDPTALAIRLTKRSSAAA
jgi:serine/threonine-protein kinase RsbW